MSPFLVTVTSGDEADHWTGGVKGPASSVACFVPRYRGSLQKGSWCVTVHVGDDRRVREVKRRIEIKLFKVQVDTSVEQLWSALSQKWVHILRIFVFDKCLFKERKGKKPDSKKSISEPRPAERPWWLGSAARTVFCTLHVCKQTHWWWNETHTHAHTHRQISLSVNKILNSSQELTHTSSTSGVDWSHELINTANDRPQPIKDGFTVSIIWAQLLQPPPDILTATSSQLKTSW